MKCKITEKQITQLAEMLDVPEETLLSLFYLGLLNTPKLTAILVKNEYETLKKREIPRTEMMAFLVKKYDISKSSIEVIIYNKPVSSYGTCRKCGVKATKYKLTRNNGFCKKCKE